MTTLGKVLIGAAAAVGLVTIVYVTKKDGYATVTSNEEKKEDKSLKERIAEAAKKKAADILNWSLTHMDEIRVATELISLVSGVACLALRMKKLYSHDRELKMLEEIRCKTYDNGYNSAFSDALQQMIYCANHGIPFKFMDSDDTVIDQFNVSLV